AGVKPGDKVIVPATTFIATARAVQMCGATPVIVDVERDTWGLDTHAASTMTAECQIRAAVVVDLYGHPSRVPYDMPYVVDATEALGASIDNLYAGFSRVGSRGLVALSFNGNKLITTGGGGMLLTEDSKLEIEARHLIDHGSYQDEAGRYCRGFNYRMPNVNAAIGMAQMETIDARLASKRETAEHYQRELPGIFKEQSWARSAYWLSCMLVPPGVDVRALMWALRANGIETRSIWRPLHRQPGLTGCPTGKIEVADDLWRRGLCLPSTVGIQADERQHVIDAIKECL
ncbi:MAG: DegT/DnrJ/EryC1/StrS family aminotransferase, partial [Betaproteobacteria bacterium]|nr:DegT/DnrJ/EryC1/StrS family aminotransferase [Betaproteobacteria bacterium]